MTPKCRHCETKTATRPRGLCWGCHADRGVRALYPSTSKYARRGVATAGAGAVPPVPTYAPPGSEEKVRVMARRVANGWSPFHPADENVFPELWLGRTPRNLSHEHDSGV